MMTLNIPAYAKLKAASVGDVVIVISQPGEVGLVIDYDGDSPIVGFLNGARAGRFSNFQPSAYCLNYGECLLEGGPIDASGNISSGVILLSLTGPRVTFRGDKEPYLGASLPFDLSTKQIVADTNEVVPLESWKLWPSEAARVSDNSQPLVSF